MAMARRITSKQRLTLDLQALVQALEEFMNRQDGEGRRICDATCGVYAFYDYDGEPIYVGQTHERLRVRIRRHLTNQRTDAVAMHVLDPMEVARVEVWPMWDLEEASKPNRKKALNAAEFTVFRKLTQEAHVTRLLNEKAPPKDDLVELPASYVGEIVNDELRARLGHADERIARRASTIADLAKVIRERDVSPGLRQTLVTQAERLEHLAKRRLGEVAGETTPSQTKRETRREADAD